MRFRVFLFRSHAALELLKKRDPQRTTVGLEPPVSRSFSKRRVDRDARVCQAANLSVGTASGFAFRAAIQARISRGSSHSADSVSGRDREHLVGNRHFRGLVGSHPRQDEAGRPRAAESGHGTRQTLHGRRPR